MILYSRLPKDRTKTGLVWLANNEWEDPSFGPVPVFGKADNRKAADHHNPTRDPTVAYGDHPTGTYAVTALVPCSQDETWTYGPYGKLVLDPVSGDALTAKQNGRFGLLIHGGGRGGPFSHGYRPTFGCLRLADHDMEALVNVWRERRFAVYQCEDIE